MKTFRIALLPGDGIGPEVLAEGVKVLRTVQSRLRGVEFVLTELPAGAEEYQRNGIALPEAVFQQCADHDAILFGAMGLPGVRQRSGVEIAPQLDLRERLDLYRGLRPVHLYHPAHSPLKGYAAGAIDLLIVRENTEGMFSSRGQPSPLMPRPSKTPCGSRGTAPSASSGRRSMKPPSAAAVSPWWINPTCSPRWFSCAASSTR